MEANLKYRSQKGSVLGMGRMVVCPLGEQIPVWFSGPESQPSEEREREESVGEREEPAREKEESVGQGP